MRINIFIGAETLIVMFIITDSVYFDVEKYGNYNKFVPPSEKKGDPGGLLIIKLK
jgi:hypothetical protein